MPKSTLPNGTIHKTPRGYLVVFTNVPSTEGMDPLTQVLHEYRWRSMCFSTKPAALQHLNDRLLTAMGF